MSKLGLVVTQSSRPCESVQRGWKRQPASAAPTGGSAPGIDASRAERASVMRGTAAISARV